MSPDLLLSAGAEIPHDQRTLNSADSPASVADWAVSTAAVLNPSLAETPLAALRLIVRALIDNALVHGQPPVTVEISTSSVITVHVTDGSSGLPVVRPDGSGSLAQIVDPLASLWDVVVNDSGKTVTASVPLGPLRPPQQRSRGAR